MKNLVLSMGLFLSFSASAGQMEVKLDGKNTHCDVRTYMAHDTTSGRCSYWDEVMVGITRLDPLTIRCARLEVRCNREAAQEEKVTE